MKDASICRREGAVGILADGEDLEDCMEKCICAALPTKCNQASAAEVREGTHDYPCEVAAQVWLGNHALQQYYILLLAL